MQICICSRCYLHIGCSWDIMGQNRLQEKIQSVFAMSTTWHSNYANAWVERRDHSRCVMKFEMPLQRFHKQVIGRFHRWTWFELRFRNLRLAKYLCCTYKVNLHHAVFPVVCIILHTTVRDIFDATTGLCLPDL